ncbi:nitroreductase family deazaflavin-dependent oxidoreductase [Nocardia sp. NPDC049149]|uniref:nitroreductase family deazaflavin-dependent oxidoreductase n=1 Tax=Nocardia sp. NPDC049149 TaxID=3364315 RepID=UPI00372029C9
MPLPRALATFNRAITNRAARLLVGRARDLVLVVHRGRNSGREYRTPVSVFRRGERYCVALTYGRGADWVRNVLAAGEFEIEMRGRRVRLVEPVVVNDPTLSWSSGFSRRILRLVDAPEYLEARAETSSDSSESG